MVNIDINELAQIIAHELMYEWNKETQTTEKVDTIQIDTLDKDCYYAVSDIKGDIFDKAVEIIQNENIKLI